MWVFESSLWIYLPRFRVCLYTATFTVVVLLSTRPIRLDVSGGRWPTSMLISWLIDTSPELTGTTGYQRTPAHERLADSFAMNFLMPEAGLKWRYHNVAMERNEGVTPADLLNMADRFQVSFEAMGRRLESLGMLRPYAVDRLLADGFRIAEARKILDRPAANADKQLLADRYCHLALEAWRNEKLSEGQLARLLRIDRTQVRELISAYLGGTTRLKDDRNQLPGSDLSSLDAVDSAPESSPCDLD